MPELSCTVRTVKNYPDVAVVGLRGNIDPRSVPAREVAMAGARQKGVRIFLFDLGEMRYINSAGLAYLVNLADAQAGRGGGIHLANVQPKVKIVFDLMGVGHFFKLYKTVGSAFSALVASRRAARPRPVRT